MQSASSCAWFLVTRFYFSRGRNRQPEFGAVVPGLQSPVALLKIVQQALEALQPGIDPS